APDQTGQGRLRTFSGAQPGQESGPGISGAAAGTNLAEGDRQAVRIHSILVALGLGLLSAPGLLSADLKIALHEKDLGKRSKLALDNAGTALKEAREAYQKGDDKALAAAALEIEDSVSLAWDSLESTGKNPRKSPRWFKQAEIETRDLLKKLDTLQRDLGFEDRPVLDNAKARLQKVHDDLLKGVMEGKGK